MSSVHPDAAGPGPKPEVTATHGAHGFSAARPKRRLFQTGEGPAEPPPSGFGGSTDLQGSAIMLLSDLSFLMLIWGVDLCVVPARYV